MAWQNNRLTEVTVTATTAKLLEVAIPEGHTFPTADKSVTYNGSVLQADLAAGESVTLQF